MKQGRRYREPLEWFLDIVLAIILGAALLVLGARWALGAFGL